MDVLKKQKNSSITPKNTRGFTILVKYWLAFFFGAILSCLLTISIIPSLANQVKPVADVLSWITVILVIIFFFLTLFKEGIFKSLFGFSEVDIKEVQDDAESLLENTITTNWSGAAVDLKKIAKKGIAWYSWKNYRRWVINLFNVLFLGFVGLFGSMLLYNQNELIYRQNKLLASQDSLMQEQTILFEKQNDKIDSQIQLEESSRRGNLIVMMSNIMDKVDEELKLQEAKNESRVLSKQLIGRIAALSQSFRPYRFLQDSMLIKKPFSLERGQLLLALVNSDLDSTTYLDIYQRATFENAYLEGANLNNVNLSWAKLKGAYLKDANLNNAKLRNTELRNANLIRAKFIDAKMEGIDLRFSDLTEAQLTNAKLIDAGLGNATLIGADLREANLRDGNLKNVRFNEADLTDAQLRKTTLGNVDFTDADLEKVWVDNENWLLDRTEEEIINIDLLRAKWTVDTMINKDFAGGIYHLITTK